MRDLHFTLDSLPPNLREQAARKLGLVDASIRNNDRPSIQVHNEHAPESPKFSRRRSGGVYKANTLSVKQNAPQTLLAAFPEGFKSIAEARAEKKEIKRRKTLTPDMARGLVKSCEVSPDGTEVRFILGCSPYMIPTSQEKKIAMIGTRPRLYKVPKVQKAEKTITIAMAPFAHHFKDWTNCPIGVWIDFCYEYPKATPKKLLVDFRYSLQKNDLDNSFKGFCDALTAAGFWDDDNKIAELHLKKFRVLTEPRIVVTIRKLPYIADCANILAEKKEWFFKDIVELKEG